MVIVFAVVMGWAVLFIWLKRRTKLILERSDQHTQQRFEQSRARFSGIGGGVFGAVFVAVMLIIWRRVPVGNEPFALAFIVFGFALILQGAYKLYRSRVKSKCSFPSASC